MKKQSKKRNVSFVVPVKPRPKTLSGWIRASVEDAQRIGKMKTFTLDMKVFNTFDNKDGKCHVCMGGAAIIGRGLAKPRSSELVKVRTFGGMRLGRSVAHAIDGIRKGFFRGECDVLVGKKNLTRFTELMRNLNVNENLSYGEKAIRGSLDIIEYEYCIKYERASWDAYLTLARVLELQGF